MRVVESFTIAAPPERLWEFFEQVDQVARCVPGVETVEVIDAENSRVRVTQTVGPMTATFDLKMRITERRPHELMQFTAVGRAVKGAAGNVRTTNTVRLAAVDEGTSVQLEAELAMGGVLGSVGQKVVAKQAGQVTRDFTDALERAIRGEPDLGAEVAAAPEPEPSPEAAGAAAPPPPGGARALPPPPVLAAAGAAVLVVVWLLVRRRRR